MDLNEYQIAAARTAIYPKDRSKEYLSLGLVAEAGEVAGKVAKFYRKDGEFPTGAVIDELGDVLWFISEFARDLGFTLNEVATQKILKLKERHKNGTIKGSGDNR